MRHHVKAVNWNGGAIIVKGVTSCLRHFLSFFLNESRSYHIYPNPPDCRTANIVFVRRHHSSQRVKTETLVTLQNAPLKRHQAPRRRKAPPTPALPQSHYLAALALLYIRGPSFHMSQEPRDRR